MIKYRDFRTGMTFTDIRRETAAKARDEYMFVTRKTVLGRWSYYKRSMYEAYQRSMGRYDPA